MNLSELERTVTLSEFLNYLWNWNWFSQEEMNGIAINIVELNGIGINTVELNGIQFDFCCGIY